MNYESTKGDCPRCAATLPKAKRTGHGSEPLEPLQAAMLLRTMRMRSVRIDSATRAARAEAGVLWQDVTVPAGQHGPGRPTRPGRRWPGPPGGESQNGGRRHCHQRADHRDPVTAFHLHGGESGPIAKVRTAARNVQGYYVGRVERRGVAGGAGRRWRAWSGNKGGCHGI